MFMTFDTWVDKVIWDLDWTVYRVPENSTLSGWYSSGMTVFDAIKYIHELYRKEARWSAPTS